ncbi:MAG: 3'-5' exonuclease [Sphingomonadaceae bacterium]
MPDAPRDQKEWPLESCVEQLESTGLYRVLRKLPAVQPRPRRPASGERVVAIVDTETTGLDHSQDEVIEFAGIAFTYSTDGVLSDAIASFSQLREPSVPLSPDTVRITGINQSMLKGKSIDKEALNAFVEGADLIVAHNAGFDRPFCEQLSDAFKHKPWACSATEIDWAGLGFDGAKLTYLVAHSGWFYEAHRALDDCNALAKVLATPISQGAIQTPFQQLLNSARETKTRLSFPAPYPLRTALRKRGFRWKASDQLQPGYWFADLSEREVKPTLDWLTNKLELRRAAIALDRITAHERYR